MNRNANSHFSVNPTNLDIGRSRFEVPFNHTSTGFFGDLIPFFWTEILPGDTLTVDTSKVIRLTTLLDPVFGNAFLDTYYFFVPMRLVWSHTKEFFGENTSGPWAPSVSYTLPKLNFASAPSPMTVADYMGIPPVSGIQVQAIPFRSYGKICTDWFMDQSTMTPPNFSTGDATVNYYYAEPWRGGQCYKASKYHDYFTSCLPAPQRGPAVTVPLTGTIPVDLSGSVGQVKTTSSMHDMGGSYLKLGYDGDSDANSVLGRSGYIDGVAQVQSGAPASGRDQYPFLKSNLVVDWPSEATLNLSGASPISVNDLRLAFQMQKWYERSAMFGGRYVEMLKAQFGVTSPDARLQRSEYLGGNRIPISIQQVENVAETSTVPLGKLGAFSHTADSNHDFTHSFTEHGVVIGVMVARYLHQYPQGLFRPWSRSTMFDFYFPVFSNIGNQAVLSKEIYCDGTADDENVFGYQEAWAEYRYMPDRVSGMMRPGISGSLGSWTFADHYTQRPTLSESWMKEDKTMIDRALAVSSSSTVPQFYFDIGVNCTFVRPMPLYSVPGLIDHH